MFSDLLSLYRKPYMFTFFICKGMNKYMIPQISYASTSSKLSDVSSTYNYFFRTAPSNVDQATAIVSLIKLYKWKKVGKSDIISATLVLLNE